MRGGWDGATGCAVPVSGAHPALFHARLLSAMTTAEIARRLVALCREQKWEEAQRELYADDAASYEPYAAPGFPLETKGLAGIVEKGHRFVAGIENLHTLTVSEPVVADGAFACTMAMDVTMKGQPRMQMSEVCVYEVKNGKIAAERFFFGGG